MNTSLKPVLCVLFVPFVVQTAHATPLSITTNFPSGTPAEVTPGLSGDITLSVFDEDPGDMAVDNRLSGYQVTLQFLPQAGSTGQLTFASTSTPTNYVLDGVSTGPNASINMLGAELFVFDAANDPIADGVDVPDTGLNIINLVVMASGDASGTFDIVAIPGAANSEWVDSADPTQIGHAFGNVPVGGGSVVIGAVTVVPEPATWLLSLLVANIFGLLCRKSHR